MGDNYAGGGRISFVPGSIIQSDDGVSSVLGPSAESTPFPSRTGRPFLADGHDVPRASGRPVFSQIEFREEEVKRPEAERVHPDVAKLETRSLYEQLKERQDEDKAAEEERRKDLFAPPKGLDEEDLGESVRCGAAAARGFSDHDPGPRRASTGRPAHFEQLEEQEKVRQDRIREQEEADRKAFSAKQRLLRRRPRAPWGCQGRPHGVRPHLGLACSGSRRASLVPSRLRSRSTGPACGGGGEGHGRRHCVAEADPQGCPQADVEGRAAGAHSQPARAEEGGGEGGGGAGQAPAVRARWRGGQRGTAQGEGGGRWERPAKGEQRGQGRPRWGRRCCCRRPPRPRRLRG